jgi:hypothetical protein
MKHSEKLIVVFKVGPDVTTNDLNAENISLDVATGHLAAKKGQNWLIGDTLVRFLFSQHLPFSLWEKLDFATTHDRKYLANLLRRGVTFVVLAGYKEALIFEEEVFPD